MKRLQIAINDQDPLYHALKKAYPVSTSESRKVGAEYSVLLASLGFGQSFHVFSLCISDEISHCDIPNLFFRGNSFSARLCMEIMRSIGDAYGKDLARPIRAHVESWTEEDGFEHEVSEGFLNLGGKSAEAHLMESRPKFLAVCDLLLDTVCNTMVPDGLKYMLYHAKAKVSVKWQDVKPEVVNSIFVLRLVIPALISDSTLPNHARRVIIRAAQVIQSLSNEVKKSVKEHDMMFVNVWMDANVERWRAWKRALLNGAEELTIEKVSSSTPHAPSSSISSRSSSSSSSSGSISNSNNFSNSNNIIDGDGPYPELTKFVKGSTELAEIVRRCST